MASRLWQPVFLKNFKQNSSRIFVWNRNNRLHTRNKKHVHKERKETTHVKVGERNIHQHKKKISTMYVVKLWFTNVYFVGFYSVPNLIVIIFNLMYPVFIMGFDCKGCVLERESVKTQASEDRRLLVGVSQLSFPRSEAYALHMIGMRRVYTDGDSCVSQVSYG